MNNEEAGYTLPLGRLPAENLRGNERGRPFEFHHTRDKDTMDNLSIKTLSINGFKAIKQFSVSPDGKSVELTGANGVGKSSVIEALFYLLTGKGAPDPVVNKDCIKTEICTTLSDGHVAEITTKGGNAKLRVFRPDGEPVNAERTYLNNLIGNISFDVFEFIKRPPSEQKKILMDLLHLDFSDLDSARRAQLDVVRDSESQMKALERQLDELKEATETAPVDVALLVEQKASRDAAASTIQRYSDAIKDITNQAGAAEAEIKEIDRQMSELAVRRHAKKQEHDTLLDRLANGTTTLDEAMASFEKMPDVSEQIAKASETNVAADRWARKQALVPKHNEADASMAGAKTEIERLDAERVRRLSEAEFPVEGLSFSEDGVLYNGLPFNERSQCKSTLIKVGCAIAISQNPGLKICRVTDGSLLDEESKKALLATLREYGYQVFIETVSKNELQALVIEEE